MNQDNSRVVQDALKSIRTNFGFLLDQGFEIYSAKDFPEAGWPVWEVILQKRDFFIRLYAERGAIDELSFRKSPDEFVDIGTVVYALTGKVHSWNLLWGFSGKGYANLLQEYLNQIESYFGEEYVQNKDALKSAQKEYREALVRKESRSEVPQKVKPFIEYPLMGILILLLAGALTPVYMLLLAGLFSFISMDDYRNLIPVVSFLLAIGTILVLRRRRKKG